MSARLVWEHSGLSREGNRFELFMKWPDGYGIRVAYVQLQTDFEMWQAVCVFRDGLRPWLLRTEAMTDCEEFVRDWFMRVESGELLDPLVQRPE